MTWKIVSPTKGVQPSIDRGTDTSFDLGKLQKRKKRKKKPNSKENGEDSFHQPVIRLTKKNILLSEDRLLDFTCKAVTGMFNASFSFTLPVFVMYPRRNMASSKIKTSLYQNETWPPHPWGAYLPRKNICIKVKLLWNLKGSLQQMKIMRPEIHLTQCPFIENVKKKKTINKQIIGVTCCHVYHI